ncbi:MAG: PKD domain-containing protein [Actinomycetota bacterium]|nr:PKD domain-containing protein [Actinomycetota bacterium]
MSPSRLTKTVLTVLAALLALPTYLVAAAVGAGAEPRSVQPGHAPATCVRDVVRQFANLKHHPEGLGFHLANGADDPTPGRHYQGISRLPGPGTPMFVTARSGNAGKLDSEADDTPGEVNIVALASRDTNGERVRSNRLEPYTNVQDTLPPPEDQVAVSLKFDGGAFPAYRHIGGTQMWGDVAVLGMDRAFGNATSPGKIALLDLRDPVRPAILQMFDIQHQASSIGVAEFGAGRLLIVTTGNDGEPIYGYEVTTASGEPTTDLTRGDLRINRIWTFSAADANISWPGGPASLQTTNLFRDCVTGDLFLMGGHSNVPLPNISEDFIGLWRLNPTGLPRMTFVGERHVWCNFDGMGRVCNLAAASGFYVSPGGDLLMYAATHSNAGPGGTVSMAEFSSRDGYDQESAYRPVAVPGTYKGAPNTPITLDGTGSRPAVAQGRVELYDEPGFGGRGLVIDYQDYGKENYLHLGRVDDYNDEASSVRWRLPARCDAVLYDDKDFKGPKVTLPGGDGSAQTIDNLRKFNDDATSLEFLGDCDGRVVSWSWDLDDDGTVDGTGPTPTVTPRTPGVHKLALTVCSGFGVCDKAVGSIDASAGTPPKTDAVLNGTAGTNGWYRSTVNVVLTATGNPTPTEIRYSATGADARGEVVVQGTTATVVVDGQGETVVRYHAVNSSGYEADKTVTVKVDTVAPALTVRAPIVGGRYTTGSTVTVLVDCTDATSGVASCTPNGTPMDTTGTGDRTLRAVATDAAGNTTPKDVAYTVTAAPAVDADLVYVARSDASPGPVQRSNADGTNVIQIADRGDDPVWSPDGSRIAYTNAPNGVRQVFVANADGTGTAAVTSNTTWNASSPAWSPDGSRIVYSGTWVEAPNATDRIIHRALLTVPATGGASTVVVSSDQVDLEDPTYTRTGASITFVGDNQIRSVPATGVAAGELGTVVVGGNRSYQSLSHPNWSPNGSTLVFQLAQGETFTSDLYAWTGSGNPVNLTGTEVAWPPLEPPTAPYEAGPTFLPDGRLVFVQDGNVYLMAAQPGAQKVLLADLPYAVRSVDARGA